MPLNSLTPSATNMHQWTNHHWFRQWLVAWPMPSHYLNQSWNFVDWTIRNKLQWHLNITYFHSRKCTLRCLENDGHFVLASMCSVNTSSHQEILMHIPEYWSLWRLWLVSGWSNWLMHKGLNKHFMVDIFKAIFLIFLLKFNCSYSQLWNQQ